ncbi:S-adenosyl-L-methionine-dependent methyltransferase [Mycena rosella]|uniref:S-adenosyl-L-methionine-dependent methyltransferase n=1 Tax=Mycena rosella TaxID=1033263 RepID=A0AAD7DF06_MYCRO|nr:S-adenosyl-L-methionine-dependent methyltransferase [Mycena rosella]
MKFRAVLDIVGTMRAALTIAVPAVLRAIFATPSLLMRPAALSRIGMASIWVQFGAGSDEFARGEKGRLITPHARGVVLDLGAGHGHTVDYLDRSAVTKYVALEPNVLMHARIRERAAAAGYTAADGTLEILSCGAEDTAAILRAVQVPVDTIVSVLTLCSVPAPQATLRALVWDALAPGGTLLFLEHVRSRQADVAWWQALCTPVWSLCLDGCCLDRPTDIWIEGLGDESGESAWAEREIWDPEGWNDRDDWFRRRLGWFVKRG